jgi:hypothetical protein
LLSLHHLSCRWLFEKLEKFETSFEMEAPRTKITAGI